MDQGQRLPPREGGPHLLAEHPLDLGLVGQRLEQGLGETQTARARLVDELQRGDIDLLGAHLTVSDHAVAAELEADYAKIVQLHEGRDHRSLIYQNNSLIDQRRAGGKET